MQRVCTIMDAGLILSNMILFSSSFNPVTLSLGNEGEPFGARKKYVMLIGVWTLSPVLGSVRPLSRLTLK